MVTCALTSEPSCWLLTLVHNAVSLSATFYKYKLNPFVCSLHRFMALMTHANVFFLLFHQAQARCQATFVVSLMDSVSDVLLKGSSFIHFPFSLHWPVCLPSATAGDTQSPSSVFMAESQLRTQHQLELPLSSGALLFLVLTGFLSSSMPHMATL